MLSLSGQRCVVVGGGPVAARRARALANCGANVVVIAPDMDPDLIRLSQENGNVELHRRGYEDGDITLRTVLVVIATNDQLVNVSVRHAAFQNGTLMNSADSWRESEVTFMACEQRGPLTVAVHSGGASASASKRIRDTLTEHLDTDWPILLEQAAIARQELYGISDVSLRRHAMMQLVDELAMHTLKSDGVNGLVVLYNQILERAKRADQAV